MQTLEFKMDINSEKRNDHYSHLTDDQDSLKIQDLPFKETLQEALLDTPSSKVFVQSIEMTKCQQIDEAYFTLENENSSAVKKLLMKTSADITIFSLLGIFQIILSYIMTDIRKKPSTFKIGVFSIFIVVAFLIVLQSAKQLTPALFIRLSEAEAGDYDLMLRSVALENDTRLTNESYVSNPIHGVRLLNGINIEKICDSMEEIEGCSARWMLMGKTQNLNYSIQTFVMIVDSQKEISIGLGRNSKANSARLQENECFLTESTRRALRIQDDSGNF